jgi:hypothetical protein
VKGEADDYLRVQSPLTYLRIMGNKVGVFTDEQIEAFQV